MQILITVMMRTLLLHAGILLLIATAVIAQSTDHLGPQAVYRKLEHALITDSKVGYLLQHTFFPSQRSSNMIFIHVITTVNRMLPGSCGVLSLLPRNAINNSYYKEFQWSSSPLLNLISIDQLLILDNVLSESIYHTTQNRGSLELSFHIDDLPCNTSEDDLLAALMQLLPWVCINVYQLHNAWCWKGESTIYIQ